MRQDDAAMSVVPQSPPVLSLAPAEAGVRPLSLRKNFAWTLAGNVVYAGCQWGMLIVLAKLGSPEMVGQFALGLAITAPIMLFCNLQLRAVQATDAKREYEFGHYLALRLITTALALVVIGGIALLAGYSRQTKLVILAVGVAKAVESISDIYYGLFQQRERMDRIATSMMIKGPLSLAAMGVTVALTGSVWCGAAAMAAAWGALLVGYDMPNGGAIGGYDALRAALVPRWTIGTLGRLAWLALPLGGVMMLISLNTNIPRYFIETHCGTAELGIFAALAYLMVAGNQVVSALGQTASSGLSRLYADRDRNGFTLALLRLLAIGVALGATGVLFAFCAGPQILRLVYRPEYAHRADLLIILMAAAGIGYLSLFLGYAMLVARYLLPQLPLFALVAMSTACLCSWAIPQDGLRGAAVAVLTGAVVQFAGSGAIAIHALRTLGSRVEPARGAGIV